MPREPRTEEHCQYVSPLGRKCRQLRAEGHPSFCQHHSGRPQHALNEASAAQLLGQIEDFASAAPVNQFLANLLRMTARGLIARRDAAVLAYIAQSLLNSLAARRREILDEQTLAENEPVTIVWDIPRPDRSEEPPTRPKRRAIERGTNACARRGPPQTQVTERKSLRWPGSDNLEVAGGGAYDVGTGPQDRECILYSQ